MLATNKIWLSQAFGSSSEERFAEDSFPFYLSMTDIPTNQEGYASVALKKTGYVRLEMDIDVLESYGRLVGIDFWEGDYEEEDVVDERETRLISERAYIPFDKSVKSIYIGHSSEGEAFVSAETIKKAKKMGIPMDGEWNIQEHPDPKNLSMSESNAIMAITGLLYGAGYFASLSALKRIGFSDKKAVYIVKTAQKWMDEENGEKPYQGLDFKRDMEARELYRPYLVEYMKDGKSFSEFLEDFGME